MGSSHSNSLNINNCSVDELLSLKGIGQCIAKRIMEQRAVCAFDSADDFVQRVKGVGLTSWKRIYTQNEVSIVFGAQTPWFTGPPKWITGEMSQRCRGKLILPRDSKFYLKGEWIVIDPSYQTLYPRTLWGIIESDGPNEKGMLAVRTGRVQVQQINWKHCVVEQFQRKEMARLRDETKARSVNSHRMCKRLYFLIYMLETNSLSNLSFLCPLKVVQIVRYEDKNPDMVRVLPVNVSLGFHPDTVRDFMWMHEDYKESDTERLQRDSFVLKHTDLMRGNWPLEDEFDHQGYWRYHNLFQNIAKPLSGKGKRTNLNSGEMFE